MPNEFETKIVHDFASDIASRLNEALIIAKMADDFGKQGLTERAFRSLLAIEPLLHQASVLLNATSIVRRRERERDIDPS